MTQYLEPHCFGKILFDIHAIDNFLVYNGFKNITSEGFKKFADCKILYNKDLQDERFRNVQEYKLNIYSRSPRKMSENSDLFSFIYFLYNDRLEYIRTSLRSIQEQDWGNIEIILILNGVRKLDQQVVQNILFEVQSLIDNGISIQIVDVHENLWAPLSDETTDPFPNLWNLGTWIAEGEFISFLSHDDILSTNYCNEMMKLFWSNDECFSAAPLPVSVNSEGEINHDRSLEYQELNKRDRYTAGSLLVKSYIEKKDLISFPGEIMSFRRGHLIEHGGIDSFHDFSQIIRLSVKGYSGFSSIAKIFWRHHNDQTNKIWAQKGYVFPKKLVTTLLSNDLYNLYSDLGQEKLFQQVNQYVRELSVKDTNSTIRISSQNYGFVSSSKALVRAVFQVRSFNSKILFFYTFVKHNIIRIAFKFKSIYINFFKNQI
jgi:hypothetical protein